MIEKRYSVTTRPTSGAMNLNDGKPDAKSAMGNAIFTLVALLCTGFGAMGFAWASPKADPFTGYLQWSAISVIGMFVSATSVVVCFRFGWAMGNITVRQWEDHLSRMRDWHKAELWAYTAQDGVETTHAVSVYELDPNVASHVLITALLIQYQLVQGRQLRTLPWSVRGLEDRLELSTGTNAILLGELPGTKPERMSERLAELGLITNRKPGSAGDWAAQSYDDVFAQFRNWAKLRNMPR